MKQRQIDLFFQALDEGLDRTAEVILVGASAGSLMGHVRPSLGIDFEIRIRGSRNAAVQERLEAAAAKASEVAGVAVNYSENVGGWSRIHYLDYRKTARPWKQIGKLKVKIMAPEYWTIGKMARFLEIDIQDMIKIIRAKKLKPAALIRLWAKALRSSDLSLELGQFRDHVLYFIRRYGKKLWGAETDLGGLLREFKKQAGLKHFIQGQKIWGVEDSE